MSDFYPQKRVLMGPGPSDVSPRVLSALGQPTIGHLDPQFISLMDTIKRQLQTAFQTQNELTFPVSAPGSAGMESCFVNLLEPGDTVVVCQNGVFGGRMKENVERCGAVAIMVEDEWGQAVSVERVQQALINHPEASVLAFVHAETSTGVCSDAKALCRLAKEHDCLTIVDTVTSLGGIDVAVDTWGADAVYSGSQKCLSGIPGISPVTFSAAAVQRIQARSHKVQSWFLDLQLVMGYWGEGSQRTYHHTAPVNMLYALHETLSILEEEGLSSAWQRHRLHHQALVAGLEAMGLSLFVDEAIRLPQLNVVNIPDGVNDLAVRKRLLDDYQLEIGAGLGPMAGRVWRIGLMGYACNKANVLLCLHALESVLIDTKGIKSGVAVSAALAVLNDHC
jgi:alanine-glyoxylate transaminase/serine-glyoxylate transaminase/serine-pyruvate transaminase